MAIGRDFGFLGKTLAIKLRPGDARSWDLSEAIPGSTLEFEFEEVTLEVGSTYVDGKLYLSSEFEVEMHKIIEEPQSTAAETATGGRTMGSKKDGLKHTMNRTKAKIMEGALAGATNTANKAIIEGVATAVESRSPEFAAFLRSEFGRPVALVLAATAAHGAASANVLPEFIPETFVQEYAERTQFLAAFEVSDKIGEELIGKIGMVVMGELSELHDKAAAIKTRYGIGETVLEGGESLDDVSLDLEEVGESVAVSAAVNALASDEASS